MSNPLIPLVAGTKKPTKGARGWASPDFDYDQPWTGLWGVRTDGIAVVDCDTQAAIVAWLDHEEIGTPTPYVVKTPRGAHFYYRLPEAVIVRPGPLCKDTDIKSGPGAYVVVPTGTVDGEPHPYQWAGDPWKGDLEKLPLLPMSVIAALLPASPPADASDHGGWDTIPEGRRNLTLTALAGAMRKQGAGANAIGLVVATVNQKLCDPPIEIDEVITIVRSVMRYEPDPFESDAEAGDIAWDDE